MNKNKKLSNLFIFKNYILNFTKDKIISQIFLKLITYLIKEEGYPFRGRESNWKLIKGEGHPFIGKGKQLETKNIGK